MTKRLVLMLLLASPFLGRGQTDPGIHFEQGLNWSQVKAKARAENKYIFLDCYATWCAPCKEMDWKTYPDSAVGRLANERFISAKVQLDTGKADSRKIVEWYEMAHELSKQYDISSLPTFLVFTPEGRIVHKDFGLKEPESFVGFLRDAVNPERQYYTLVDRFLKGTLALNAIADLAVYAKNLGEDSTAAAVSQYYIKNYLGSQPEDSLYTKRNLEFIGEFTSHSGQVGFSLFYHHGTKIDSVIGIRGYSSGIISSVIVDEEVNPVMTSSETKGEMPDWKFLKLHISGRYNNYYSDRCVVGAEINWYRVKKNWTHYTKDLVYWVEKYGKNMHWINLNNYAWEVFLHSNKKSELNGALSWSLRSQADGPPDYVDAVDTYANLLYKLDRKREAIAAERRALRMAGQIKDMGNIKIFGENIDKMKEGKPTWL